MASLSSVSWLLTFILTHSINDDFIVSHLLSPERNRLLIVCFESEHSHTPIICFSGICIFLSGCIKAGHFSIWEGNDEWQILVLFTILLPKSDTSFVLSQSSSIHLSLHNCDSIWVCHVTVLQSVTVYVLVTISVSVTVSVCLFFVHVISCIGGRRFIFKSIEWMNITQCISWSAH